MILKSNNAISIEESDTDAQRLGMALNSGIVLYFYSPSNYTTSDIIISFFLVFLFSLMIFISFIEKKLKETLLHISNYDELKNILKKIK